MSSEAGRVRSAVLALAVVAASACGGGGSGGGGDPTNPTPGTFEVIVPNFSAANPGSFGQAMTSFRFQSRYGVSQLGAIPVGARITGLRLRQDIAQTSATPAGTMSRFDIRVGPGATTMTSNLPSNFTSPATTVRTGSYTWGASDYPADPGTANTQTTPEPWGPVIVFSTPYVYTGGPLLIEFFCADAVQRLGADFAYDFVSGAQAYTEQVNAGLTQVIDVDTATGSREGAFCMSLVIEN